jgi:hypothetical protein
MEKFMAFKYATHQKTGGRRDGKSIGKSMHVSKALSRSIIFGMASCASLEGKFPKIPYFI